MKYIVKIVGQGFETLCDTLAEAEAEAKRITDKVPQQKDNIYINELSGTEIPTGAWYKYDRENNKYVRRTI